MAIRNVKFGGTDWTPGFVPSADLNDTFDAVYNLLSGWN